MSTPKTADSANRLSAWLETQLENHPTEIELGLERVGQVADRLGVRQPAPRNIVVAGTNGKGSCVALIAGLIGPRARIGRYSSPHLFHYNERIVIDGQPVSDADLVRAFDAIEAVRGDTSLTFFEWGTLAAFWLFHKAGVDIAVLEIGLGGRLDAVNIVDSDVALVVSIALDHMAWLGNDRETIGYEKAGIFRPNGHALCSDRDMPASIAAYAKTIGADLEYIGQHFDIRADVETWHIRDGEQTWHIAPQPGVRADNLTAAMAVVHRLGMHTDEEDIARAVAAQRGLIGRREWQDGTPTIVYDVGHNEAALSLLVDELGQRSCNAVHLVIGMLADKSIETIGALFAPVIDHWYPAGLETVTPRGASGAVLAQRLGRDAAQDVYSTPREAMQAARAAAGDADCIVVCGSFYTVAELRNPEHE